MRRILPSMTALRGFEAAARRLSFSRAAEELGVTQGAVSRQMRALEDLIGKPLFRRVGRRLVLTAAGEAFLPEVKAILDHAERATLEIMAFDGHGGLLSIGMPPTFGSRWLVPRLGRFSARFPGIDLNLVTRIRRFDFDADQLDAAIQVGPPEGEHLQGIMLMGEEMVPVCSPVIRKGDAGHPLKTIADLRHHSLLHLSTRPEAWVEWLRHAGLGEDIDFARRGPVFEQFSMVIQAALAGLGIAMVPRFLVIEELATRRLIIPFDLPVASPDPYYLVYPKRFAALPKIVQFRDWILQEAAADREDPQALAASPYL